MDTYGLLSNEATAVMQNNIASGDKLLVVGRKGVINTRMLYDWWYVYAVKNNLIVNRKWISPNDVLNALLADEYIKFGAVVGKPYAIQTYFAMLGNHIDYTVKLDLSDVQNNYLIDLANIFRRERLLIV